MIEKSPFQMPGSSYTSYVGLTLLMLVIVGIPLIAAVLVGGWFAVRSNVVANTSGKIKSVWTDSGPRYEDAVDPDALEAQIAD